MILAVNSRQHLTTAPLDPSYARYITLVLLAHSMDMPTDAYVSFFLSRHTSRVSESRTWRRASAHSQSQMLSHQFYVMPVYFIANRLLTLILNTTMTSRYMQTFVCTFLHVQVPADAMFPANFLHSNYKQALDILTNGNVVLPKLMQDLKVVDESDFDRWLDEEKVHLKGLTREPEQDTLHMEYWQKLVNLGASK